MDSGDFDNPSYFTTDGKDIWEMISCCIQPSCRLRNMKTGDEREFGMGSLMADSFHRIKMPIISKEGGDGGHEHV